MCENQVSGCMALDRDSHNKRIPRSFRGSMHNSYYNIYVLGECPLGLILILQSRQAVNQWGVVSKSSPFIRGQSRAARFTADSAHLSPIRKFIYQKRFETLANDWRWLQILLMRPKVMRPCTKTWNFFLRIGLVYQKFWGVTVCYRETERHRLRF
jgi:hypothetical protein